jgi:hypothetical protein
MTKFEEIKKYADDALESFVEDPADSLYQEGYYHAIQNVRKYITDIETMRGEV